ncbi:PREDICTED: adrenodoxin-like protein 2, mitochondrial isoform X1 [Camelina sativa]|uniref:Adrenodoxin-like protein 2, mitochondrial isoform X1 n=1 Tax=Camelina sativa TaxID=90675 RepID=A0ABM1QKF9_CAMSA|nr:PREDICTED: adrenodoxin-like protein 2, mitochondrial isoform X1 [Camelina sativa]
MLFNRLSRLGSSIVKELPRERHFSMRGMRILQRSYGQYLQSSESEHHPCQYHEMVKPFIGYVMLNDNISSAINRERERNNDLALAQTNLVTCPMPQRQTRSFHEAFFSSNHHMFSASYSTASEKGGEETEKINVIFVDKDGEEIHVKVPIGMNILEAAHENDIELEGACEGSLACSTCHVIVMDTEYYNKLEEPTDEENDMLDLAFGLTETSRLGCQVIAKPELDGVRLAIPSATRNFAVDGFVPKPH